MARDFDGSADYADLDPAPDITTGAICMWVYFNSLPSSGDVDGLATWFESGQTEEFSTHDKNLAVYDSGTSTHRLFARIYDGAVRFVTGSTNLSTGQWYHVGFDHDGTTLRLYLDGSSDGSTSAGNSFNFTNPAVRICGIPSTYDLSESTRTRADAIIAEMAIYDASLDASEWAALGAGVSPALVATERLAAYTPIGGRSSPEINLVSSNTLSLTSAPPASAHPRIIQPSAQIIPFAAAAAVAPGAVYDPIFNIYYRKLMAGG